MKKGYWVLPIIAFFLAVFSPVFFDLANGSSYYVNGSYAPNWSAASIFGSLFVFGPTAVLALLPFSLVGMAMAHYMLEDKKATGLFRAFFFCRYLLVLFSLFGWHVSTEQRKSVCAFISMIVMMIGVELKSFDDQRNYTNEIVKKYIFSQYSFVPTFTLFLFLLDDCFFLFQCGANVVVMDVDSDWCVWHGVCNSFDLL